MQTANDSAVGSIWVSIPCHHPAWPRHCDLCGELALGLPVSVRISHTHAYGFDATACTRCHRVAVRESEGPVVTMAEVVASIQKDIFTRGSDVVVLDRATYDARCIRTPLN